KLLECFVNRESSRAKKFLRWVFTKFSEQTFFAFAYSSLRNTHSLGNFLVFKILIHITKEFFFFLSAAFKKLLNAYFRQHGIFRTETRSGFVPLEFINIILILILVLTLTVRLILTKLTSALRAIAGAAFGLPS